MRHVALTSPPMRGRDIKHLQGVLNGRLAHYRSRRRLHVDGIYGRDTDHALHDIGYIMGLEPPYGRRAALERILHPWMLTPTERHRSAHRQRERRQHHIAGANPLSNLVHIAQRYVGVYEHPAGSNWGYPHPAQWLREFGLGPAAWCGAFAGAMIRLAGGHVGSGVCFVPNIESAARSRTGGFDLWRANHNEGVEPGWLVLYNWLGGREPEHVGIVKEIHSGHLIAVEGNTSGVNRGHGGMVGIESRPYSFTVGYARPRL